MKDLQVFTHPDFGSMEVWIDPNGKPWFPATESAQALGYANPRQAVIDHCSEDGVAFRDVIDSMGRPQKKKYINRPNLSRLIARSHLPEAAKFESWIFEEVLESVFDHGGYSARPLSHAELSLLQAQALVDLERKQQEQQAALETVTTRLDNIGDIIALNPTAWRGEAKKMIVRIAHALGGNEYIKDVHAEIYSLMLTRFSIDLSRRLSNRKAKMALEGANKTQRDSLSKVDIIAEDKKAVEAYLMIIKELAIKHGVDSPRD